VKLSERSSVILLAALIVFTAVFYILTLRDGHDWGDDFALYIMHARNLVNGIPYSQIGLIPNPAVPHLGPSFYPPGFPFMLVPAIKAYGIDFRVLKIVVVLCFAASLWFVFFLFRDRLPYSWTLALVALLALSPVFWKASNSVTSDIPFLFVAYGNLWLIQWTFERTGDRPALWYAVPIGLSMYAAYAVRPQGAMLLPAFGLYGLLKARRIQPFLIVTGLIVAAGIGIQMAMLGQDSRFSLMKFSPSWLISSIIQNIKDYREWWLNGYSQAFSYALFGVVLAITAFGLWVSIRKSIRIYDLFALCYLLAVIPYTAVVERYLDPVCPILMLYLLTGLYHLKESLPAGVRRPVLACCIVAVLASYGTTDLKADRGPIREGLFDPDFVELCRFVRSNTPADSRFIFRKPRVFILGTDRVAAVYNEPDDRADLWKFIRSIGASYIIVANIPSIDFDSDRTYLQPFVAAHQTDLTRVYQNGHYELFHIN